MDLVARYMLTTGTQN